MEPNLGFVLTLEFVSAVIDRLECTKIGNQLSSSSRKATSDFGT